MSATLVATTNEVNAVSNINTYTTIAPMATLLQQEYARVTAFAIAECEVDCGNTVTYGQTGCIELPRLGDLMTSSFFRIDRKGLRAIATATTGPVPDPSNVHISAVPAYAHALFAYMTFEVGGQIVDKLTADLLQMIEELASPAGNTQGAMIGDFADLESIRQQTFNNTTYYVAVRFFYFDSVEMAAPLIAWSAHQIRYRYQLNDKRTLFNITIDGSATPANIGDFLSGTTYVDGTGVSWHVDADHDGEIEKISYIARIICATQAERACIAGDIIETLFTQWQYEDYDSIPLGQTSKTTLMSYNNLGLMSLLRFRADFYTDVNNCDTKDYFDYTLRRGHTDFTAVGAYTPTTGVVWDTANQRPTWFTGTAHLYVSPISRWSLTNNGQLRYDITRDWGTQVVPFLYAVKKPSSQFLSYCWHLSPLVGASAPSGTSINWSRINQPIERVYFDTFSGSSVINADNLNINNVTGTAPTGNIPASLFHANKSFNVSKTVAGHLQVSCTIQLLLRIHYALKTLTSFSDSLCLSKILWPKSQLLRNSKSLFKSTHRHSRLWLPIELRISVNAMAICAEDAALCNLLHEDFARDTIEMRDAVDFCVAMLLEMIPF
jgi:hypothetical protein